MINLKVLLQAVRFAFLPTLSILLLLSFGFFSITKTLDFISSNEEWAIFTRVSLSILEVALIVVMYFYYLKKHNIEIVSNNPESFINKILINLSGGDNISRISDEFSYYDKVEAYKTKIPNIYLIKRIPKTE